MFQRVPCSPHLTFRHCVIIVKENGCDTGSFSLEFISRRFACIYLIPVPFKKTKTIVQTTMQISIFQRFSWIRAFVKWNFPEQCTSQWLRRRKAMKKFAS